MQFGLYSTNEDKAGLFFSNEQTGAIKSDFKDGILATVSGVDYTLSGFVNVTNQNEFAGSEKSTTSILLTRVEKYKQLAMELDWV